METAPPETAHRHTPPPETARRRTPPPETSRHRTPPPETACHRTAPPETVRHRTAPPKTARHRTRPPKIARHRTPPTYTFHYAHGKNIKLCSSGTVAVRTAEYIDVAAVVSQPLRRGHTCTFRVDKIAHKCWGSPSIGVLASLPSEMLPLYMMRLRIPSWLVSGSIITNNSHYMKSDFGKPLNDLKEKSVLSLHFRFNSDLVLEIDGNILGAMASIPLSLPHVFPAINVYGKVCQVSILQHPYIITGGLSVDLPTITENLREESPAESKV